MERENDARPDVYPSGPPGAGDGSGDRANLRGTHVAWARIASAREEPAADSRPRATETGDRDAVRTDSERTLVMPQQPARPVPVPRPPPTRVEFSPVDHLPTTIGRLVAFVVTVGLAWALGVAILVWGIVVLVSR